MISTTEDLRNDMDNCREAMDDIFSDNESLSSSDEDKWHGSAYEFANEMKEELNEEGEDVWMDTFFDSLDESLFVNVSFYFYLFSSFINLTVADRRQLSFTNYC